MSQEGVKQCQKWFQGIEEYSKVYLVADYSEARNRTDGAGAG